MLRTKTKRRKFNPTLEWLEDRSCPSVNFTFTAGGGNSTWENSANWRNDGNLAGANAYPGGGNRNDDIAILDGGVDNTRDVLTAGGFTLAGLNIQNGRTRNLVLNGAVALAGNSGMSSNANIWQTAAGATITQRSGTFTWSNGNINYVINNPVKSTFTVGAGAVLVVSYSGAGTRYLGDDLVVAAADGSGISGTVYLQNTGIVALYNTATITNNGEIQISVTGDLDKARPNDPTVTITNNGTIWKNAGGIYYINEPILNNGTVQVDDGAGTVFFDDSTAATMNTSFYQPATATGAILQLAGNATIQAGDGYRIDAGSVNCLGTNFTCTITGTGTFTMNGGTLNVGVSSDFGSYGTLTFRNLAGGINWNGGTWNFTYNIPTSTLSIVQLGNNMGNLTIAATGPTMGLTFLNGTPPNPLPSPLDVIICGAASRITDNSDPAPTSYTGSVVNNGRTYRLTLVAPG
jgi:hypothetical protein